MLNILLLQVVDFNQKFLFKSDKIYTVLTVMLIIWLGTVLHLLYINSKISKLEKVFKDKGGDSN